MLRVQGEIILEHNIQWLKRYGINEIFINLHYFSKVIPNYFGNGQKWGVNITYSYEENLLGTAGAVRKIVKENPSILNDGNFLVIYGDNFYPFHYNLKDFIDFHYSKSSLTSIGLYQNKNEIKKSGVALLDQNHLIVDFVEKPLAPRPKSNLGPATKTLLEKGLINTGIYLLNKRVLEFIPEGSSDFGKDIFPQLMKKKFSLYGFLFEGKLIPIDTVELYKKVSQSK